MRSEPSRCRYRYAWVINRCIAILTVRHEIMARGTVRLLSEKPGTSAVLVIMGRAHLRGTWRELVEQHGYRVI